jgi:hypothetical protein
MTKVGPYRVIDTKRLLIPKDQESWLRFLDGTATIDVQIVFESDSDPKVRPTLRFEGLSTHLRLVFKNWRDPFGLSTASPIHCGTTDAGEPLHFMAASWMIGDTRVVDVQMMAGGAQ